MFDIHRVELDWGGRKLVLETGRIARQADGAVLASYGETTVLATVVSAKEPREGIDFLPLTCNYQEKFYAAGRIPGGYFKREGRPTERETLVSRLIDRPIRPLFAEGYRCDTQVIATVHSHDLENDPDIVAMVAASAALTLLPGSTREYSLNDLVMDVYRLDLSGPHVTNANNRFDLPASTSTRGGRGIRFDPDEVWVVGDTARDLECARVVGAHCALVATGRSSDLSGLGADVVWADLSDVDTVVGALAPERDEAAG